KVLQLRGDIGRSGGEARRTLPWPEGSRHRQLAAARLGADLDLQRPATHRTRFGPEWQDRLGALAEVEEGGPERRLEARHPRHQPGAKHEPRIVVVAAHDQAFGPPIERDDAARLSDPAVEVDAPLAHGRRYPRPVSRFATS